MTTLPTPLRVVDPETGLPVLVVEVAGGDPRLTLYGPGGGAAVTLGFMPELGAYLELANHAGRLALKLDALPEGGALTLLDPSSDPDETPRVVIDTRAGITRPLSENAND